MNRSPNPGTDGGVRGKCGGPWLFLDCESERTEKGGLNGPTHTINFGRAGGVQIEGVAGRKAS